MNIGPKTTILTIVAFIWGSCATAQDIPDIVWATNAHFAPITSVAFSADSMKLASGSQDRNAHVWTVPHGVLERTVTTPNEWMLSVALSPDGTLLGTGGDEGHTRMWQVSDGLRLWGGGTAELPPIYSLDFHPTAGPLQSHRVTSIFTFATS